MAALLADTAKRIEQRFQAAWSETAVEYENQGSFAKPANLPWLRFSVIPDSREQIGIPDTIRQTGRVVGKLYGLIGQGSRALLVLADTFADLFTRTQIEGSVGQDRIQFQTARVAEPVKEDERYVVSIIAPYYRTEV